MRCSRFVVNSLAAAFGVLAACSSDTVGPDAGPVPWKPGSDHLTPPPVCSWSFTAAYMGWRAVKKGPNGNIECAPYITVDPPQTLYHTAYPNGPNPPYTGVLTISFDRPVYNVWVTASNTLICQPFLGEVRLYNGGALVSTTPLLPQNVCDQWYNVHYGAWARPAYIGAVTRMEIQGPDQWTGTDYLGRTTYHTTYYAIQFYETAYTPPPNCPPFGDMLLDSTALRLELERVLQQALNHPKRVETRSLIWKNRTTGAIRFQELQPIDFDTVGGCWIATSHGHSTDTEDLIATFHPHPRQPDEWVTCGSYPDKQPLPPRKIDYSSWGGGSPSDWLAALALSRNAGRIVPTYVIDPHEIHKLNPVDSLESKWAMNAQHWNRHPSSCVYQ